jgi:hypothetical protein
MRASFGPSGVCRVNDAEGETRSRIPSSPAIVYLREKENHESENDRDVNRMQVLSQRTFCSNSNNEDGIHDKI